MNTFKITTMALLSFFILLVSSCTQETRISINETQLEKLEIKDFILPNENDNFFGYKEKGKTIEIENVVSFAFTAAGDFYTFLSTETEFQQMLLVISKKRNLLQWTVFYPKTSHFFTEQLIAFVIKPFPERHLEEEIFITDFINNKQLAKVNSSKRSDFDDKLQDLYYLEPSFNIDEDGLAVNIFWEQAHYPMSTMMYVLDSLNVWFSSNDDDYTLAELNVDTNVLEFPMNTLPENTAVLCAQQSGKLSIGITTDSTKPLDWDNCFISIAEATETKQIPLASVFRYQDELLSIQSAIPVDHRAAFIITTAEFSYDFYFDPITGTSDAFLRPSSFTTRYVK